MKKFLEVFDSITKEGYELKAKESVTDPIPKLCRFRSPLYLSE
ncbi:MAG: hypothetical protein ACRBB5_07825 [Nitrosopumilus sp.]